MTNKKGQAAKSAPGYNARENGLKFSRGGAKRAAGAKAEDEAKGDDPPESSTMGKGKGKAVDKEASPSPASEEDVGRGKKRRRRP
jgi:hypothetical protein